MAENKVDKVIKNILPVGSYVSFSNDTNPNNLFEGTWYKVGSYTNIIQYNSVELVKDISGTTATSKTALLGIYFDDPVWCGSFVNSCPGGYYPVARLAVYGYTAAGNVITVYLNNKKVDLSTWGPATFTGLTDAGGWWAWSTLTAENTTYNLENGNKGLNLYYSVSSPDASWKIHYIKLDLGFAPYNNTVQWVRTA